MRTNRTIAALVAVLLLALSARADEPLRAQGRILDAAGAAVSGDVFPYRVGEANAWRSILPPEGVPEALPVLGRSLELVPDARAGAVASEHPQGKGYFDFPGGLPAGAYWLDVVMPGGAQGWAGPYEVKPDAGVPEVRIGGPTPPAPAPDDPGPGSFTDRASLSRHFTAGTWTYAFSYYGAMSGSPDVWATDLAALEGYGIRNLRVWPDWSRLGDEFRTFDRQGRSTPERLARLHRFVDLAASYGMSVDLTLACDAYDFTKKSAEGYDITPHKRVVETLTREFKGDAAVAFLDVCNEGRKRGGASTCNGSPEWGHISPGRFLELYQVARAIDPARRLTTSSDGHPTKDSHCGNDSIVYFYRSVEARGARINPYTPHFPRTSSAPDSIDDGVRALRNGLRPDGVVYAQEEFRRGRASGDGVKPNDSNRGDWSADDFTRSIQGARGAGAVGWCLHNDTAYSLRDGPAITKLDPIERSVLEWIKAHP